MSTVNLLPPQQPPSNVVTFLLGGRLSSPCCSSKEVTFSYTEQTRSILSPHDIWVWGGMKEVMLMGSLARAGVLCSNRSWLSPAQTHNTHLAGTLEDQKSLLPLHFEDGGPHSSLGSALLHSSLYTRSMGPTVFQPGSTGAVCR